MTPAKLEHGSRHMVRALAAAGCILALVSCDSSISLRPAPPGFGADSPAANLGVHFGLLFAEHTIAFGKLTLAAAAGRAVEFRADAALLAANGTDVADALTSALGPTSSAQVDAAWTAGDNGRVDYIVAAVTHDQAKADAASSQLDSSVSALSNPLEAALSHQDDNLPRLAQADVAEFRKVVDDAVAGTYEIALSDLVTAASSSAGFGQLLASDIARQFPDRYPGDPQTKAAQLRAGAGVRLEIEAYLLTSLTNATVASATGEQSAAMVTAGREQTSITGIIADLFGASSGTHLQATWAALTQAVVAYAKSGDAASHGAALAAAIPPSDTYGPDLTGPVAALLQVVDDQRTPTLTKLPSDDRSAAAQFAAVADGITDAAIRLAPSKLA